MDISPDDIWYAAKQTRIVHSPEQKLETFGETKVHYYLVSELLDTVGQVRIRDGVFEARRPRLITPDYLARQLTENFGREARQYAQWLVDSGEAVRLLEYGLSFYKDQHRERVITGNPETVSDNIVRDQEAWPERMFAVIIGVDDLWEVSLLRFASRLIQDSVPRHLRELSRRGLLDASGESAIPAGVRVEIENEFQAARGKPERIKSLGRKLQDFGVFAEYEDRLYALLRELG